MRSVLLIILTPLASSTATRVRLADAAVPVLCLRMVGNERVGCGTHTYLTFAHESHHLHHLDIRIKIRSYLQVPFWHLPWQRNQVGNGDSHTEASSKRFAQSLATYSVAVPHRLLVSARMNAFDLQLHICLRFAYHRESYLYSLRFERGSIAK